MQYSFLLGGLEFGVTERLQITFFAVKNVFLCLFVMNSALKTESIRSPEGNCKFIRTRDLLTSVTSA